MKTITTTCLALAFVLGTTLVADAQVRSRNGSQQKRDIGKIIDHFKNKKKPKYKTVYDIRIEPAFKGHIFIVGYYQATWRVKSPGLSDVMSQDNFADRFRNTWKPATAKWIKGVDPNSSLTFLTSCRAHFANGNKKLRQPDAETIRLANYATGGKRHDVELASSDFRVRFNFKIYERQVKLR